MMPAAPRVGRLHEKVVIITGSGRGIGRTTAFGCAAEGARVIIADVDAELATQTRDDINDVGGLAWARQVDVSDEASVDNLFSWVIQTFHRVDALVNNAALVAGIARRPVNEVPSDEWDRVMSVNAKGVWLACRAVSPIMQSQGQGRIINISSNAFLYGSPGLSHYVASKGAVVGITRSLARELGQFNVCVNAVAPGFTLTDAALEHGQEAKQRNLELRAISRAQVPDDVTGTIVYLISGDSAFVTGQMIVVNGGAYMY